MHGIFPAFAFRSLPDKGGHSWLEIELDDAWRPNFGDKGFVHMGAVVEDHGAWDDVADYAASPAYGRMNRMQQMVYPWLARMNNRTIEGIRDARPKVN